MHPARACMSMYSEALTLTRTQCQNMPTHRLIGFAKVLEGRLATLESTLAQQVVEYNHFIYEFDVQDLNKLEMKDTPQSRYHSELIEAGKSTRNTISKVNSQLEVIRNSIASRNGEYKKLMQKVTAFKQ